MLTPVKKTNSGIVMEFKVGGNADEIADIRAYGIAFCGKKAVVKTVQLR